MSVTADPLGAHVAALDRVLVGPVRCRRSMIAEVRDGLQDAAAAYREAGLDPHAAATAAVHDFGGVDEIAPLLQEELTARQGRTTALLLVVVFPAMLAGWDALWRSGAGWTGRPPEVVLVLARMQDVTTAAVAAAALVLLALTFRRGASPRRLTGLVGSTAATGVALCGGGGIVMNLANGQQAADMIATQPATVVALVASVAAMAIVVRSAVRSLRIAHVPHG